MNKRNLLLAPLLLLSFILSAQIQEDPTRWKFEVKNMEGNLFEVVTTCTFADKDWHLYSFNPGGDGTLLAPELSYSFPSGAQKIGNTSENGKLQHEDIKGVGRVNYFKNKVVYKQKFKADKDGTVKGSVTYQTCNDQTCIPPKTIDFSVPYKVKKDEKTKVEDSKEEATTTTNTDTNTSASESAITVETNDDSSSTDLDTAAAAAAALSTGDDNIDTTDTEPAKESNLNLLFLGILAGLASIITPCVFAMLPMVVSLFLKRSKSRQDSMKVATQYSLSIVGIFALFGLILTLFVRDGDVLHRFATNWITNVVLFFVFVIFAISFLGGFEITLPSSWSTATDKKANTNSFLGVFFMALTLVIVSFSCTLPFIGGLATAITNGTGSAPFWGFLGYGIGLGLPFTLFVMFPGWLTAINKQGGWLNAFKVVLGFVELALAFKFLSNADLVKGWRLLDREVFIAIWSVISVVAAMYLFGFFKLPKDSDLPENAYGQKYLSITRLFFALAFFIFGIYLFPGMWGAPLKGMGAFLPPFGTFDAFNSGASVAATESSYNQNGTLRRYADKLELYEPDAVAKYDLNMIYDYEDALALSKETGKPIMLDFTGIACANCRKMEAGVWADPTVGKLLHDNFIIASLFSDAYNVKLTPDRVYTDAKGKKIEDLGSQVVDIQISKYNSNTQPNYFFIDGDENLLRSSGYGYTTQNDNPERFAAVLNEAYNKYQETHQ